MSDKLWSAGPYASERRGVQSMWATCPSSRSDAPRRKHSRKCVKVKPMPIAATQLLQMSQQQLDALFGEHDAGPIPDGEAKGTAIIVPGTPMSEPIAAAINIFAWQGKVFDAKAGLLRNEILPFGLKAIIASVYKGPSWLDGKECIVLDYSETSLVASHIRDEIRQIEPGLYLGKVYWDKARLIDFSLDFNG